MIDALIKRVSVTYKCYEMYAHRGKKVQLLSRGDVIIIVKKKRRIAIHHPTAVVVM
jgi:hypothetical protein